MLMGFGFVLFDGSGVKVARFVCTFELYGIDHVVGDGVGENNKL